MKDRNPVWIIGLLTLVINIAGWFGNYYFVTRHQAELDKKQIGKIENELKNLLKKDELQIKYLEKSIEKIEKDIVKLDDKSEKILERLSIDEKRKVINNLERETIKNIQPAIHREVTLNYVSSNKIFFTYNLKNIGKYPVKVNGNLYLSTTEINPYNNYRNQLLPSKYLKVVKIENIHLTPEEDCPSKTFIELINPDRIPKKIYYFVIFEVETDYGTIKSLNKINLTKDEIERIKNKEYYSWGSIEKD